MLEDPVTKRRADRKRGKNKKGGGTMEGQNKIDIQREGRRQRGKQR